MSTRTRSEWRERSRRVIQSVLAHLPADADAATKRRLLRNAYPFGVRKHHPYRMWCEEVRRAMGEPKPVTAKVSGWVLTDGLHLMFFCRWCERVVGLASMACLQCLPEFRRVEGLFEHSEFKPLLLAARADPDDRLRRGVLADWLRDRGEDELADLFAKGV